jgi:hypothetical protein
MLSNNNSILKNSILEKEKLEKKLKILDYNSINSLIVLYYEKNVKIIEDPLFYSSKNSIISEKNQLYLILRECAFSGLEGKIKLDETANILFEENGRYLLNFLSIFSGRLYELRSKYLFSLLPTGYAEKMKNNLIGYHYPESFRSNKVIGRNKSIHEMKEILEEKFGKNNLFLVTKYKLVNCYLNKSNLILGNILLGSKILVKNLEIHCYFYSLDDMNNKKELIYNLRCLAPIYSPFFTIKTYINNEMKILLGEYALGMGEQKTRNKRLYAFYDETHVFLNNNIL